MNTIHTNGYNQTDMITRIQVLEVPEFNKVQMVTIGDQ